MSEENELEAFKLNENFQTTVFKGPSKNNSKWFLWFSVITVCLILVSSGAAVVWTSPILEKFKSNDTRINPLGDPITVYEESLITSLHGLGLGVGPLLLGKLADILGRKRSIILFSTLEVIGFFILSFGKHVYFYYFARTIQGFCFGFLATVMPVYIAEIAEDSNRGRFGTFISLFATLGNIYGYVMSLIFDTKVYTLICAVPGIFTVILFCYFVPESPIYLKWKRRPIEAKKSLQKFHNLNSTETDKVFNKIKIISSNNQSFRFAKLLEIRKSLFISGGLLTFLPCTGLFAILGYLSSILHLSNDIASIAVSCTQFIAILISSMLIEKFGRRILILISSAIVFISLFVLGTYFHLVSFFYITKASWVPILTIVIFIMGYGIGFGPVTFVILGEIFPIELKTTAASMSMFLSGCSNFLVIFLFPLCRDMLGLDWCFWILGLLSVLGYIFIFVCIPETKGKSFCEIQKMINGN